MCPKNLSSNQGEPRQRPRRGDELVLPVTSLAFGGKGIGREGDFVVFVDGGVPGDVAHVIVTKAKKRYAEARVLDLVSPSPDRLAAQCPVFGLCGGCTWQDLRYDVQLEYKARQVRESLEHLGGLDDVELRPAVGMIDPWRYRNRADFSIGNTAEGAIVGFRPRGRWDSVLPLTHCHIVGEAIEGVRSAVESWLRDHDVEGWDPRTNTGYARHLLVRSAQLEKELLVSLVTAGGDLPYVDDLVARLRAAFPQIVGIVHAVNEGRAELSSGLGGEALWGRPYLIERVLDTELKVSLDAFFQTNSRMAQVLYRIVADEAGVTACSRPVIWDLYSGVGGIGLSLARGAEAVLCIESVPAAVLDAHENARLNLIKNAHFIEGDVAKVLREVAEGRRQLPSEVARPDVIIIDPPRSGLSKKTIARIAEVAVPRIVYVSCNPATMAANIAGFAEYAYRLDHVTPVDMFPHTPHIECCGLLVKERPSRQAGA